MIAQVIKQNQNGVKRVKKSRVTEESKQGRMEDALALGDDEGRDKLR